MPDPGKAMTLRVAGEKGREDPPGMNALFPSRFFQEDAVIDEVELFDPGPDSFLFSKDVLKIEFVTFRPKDHEVLEDQFLFTFLDQIRIRFTHRILRRLHRARPEFS
jgi:hypothetical protein